MLQLAQFIATLSCTLFAGAALYINLVEHPARMGCSTELAATVWAPSYKRATWMQAPLALLSSAAAMGSGFLGGGVSWLVGGVVILAVVPFTIFAIAPTNRELLAPKRDRASSDTRALLDRWGRLHAVRSLLSVCASAIFLWLLAWG